MDGSSRYLQAVLALTTAFFLVCGTWFLARTSQREPYRVNTLRDPMAAEDTASAASAAEPEDIWPDSLLPGERIDVNTASVYDLRRLPGIGEKRAQDIVDYREEHGPFQSAEELMNVSGIGPGILESLRDYVTIENK